MVNYLSSLPFFSSPSDLDAIKQNYRTASYALSVSLISSIAFEIFNRIYLKDKIVDCFAISGSLVSLTFLFGCLSNINNINIEKRKTLDDLKSEISSDNSTSGSLPTDSELPLLHDEIIV